MYARGILFGKMKYELGDHSFVRCPEHNLAADIEFKTKGYFGGTYNAISGVIKNEQTGETLFELSGMWSGEMTLRNVTVCSTFMGFGKAELIIGIDRSERGSIQCDKRKAYTANSQTPRRTGEP